MRVPALTRHLRGKRLLRRVTLHPHEDGAQVQHHVDRDNNEPGEPADPPLGDAEQRDGEARLAPGGTEDGPEARHVHDEEELGEVGALRDDVPAVVTEAHCC